MGDVQCTKDIREMHTDPSKMWGQFVHNMVPVIKRVVKFSKKLPGEYKCSSVGGDGGCTVDKVQAGTTSPMPEHNGF